MASKIKKTVKEELLNVMALLDEGSTKYNLLEGLYNQIDKYDNDKDIVNLVWANKDLPLRMFTNAELEMMPGFNNLLVGEPRTGEVNLEKSFGKDWAYNFENIPYNQIALVAEKNGVDPKELMNSMRKEATEQRRKEIANEGVLGKVMPFVAKRTQEAIERGETPSISDVGLDVAQTGLEALPYGRAAKLINNPYVRTAVGGVLSNTMAPILTEAADAAVYDSNTDRGEFKVRDVASGTAANAMGANLIRLLGAGLKKFGGDRISNVLMNLGNRESREDAINAVHKLKQEIAKKEEIANTVAKFKGTEGQKVIGTKTTYPVELRREALDYIDNAKDYAKRVAILNKLGRYYPVTNEGKLIKEIDKNILGKDDLVFSDKQLRYIANDPVLSKYLNNLRDLPSNERLAAEESIKNFITNKLGNQQAEQGKVWTRIPLGLGRYIQEAVDELDKEEARRQLEEDIYNQYRFDILGGN